MQPLLLLGLPRELTFPPLSAPLVDILKPELELLHSLVKGMALSIIIIPSKDFHALRKCIDNLISYKLTLND